MVGGKSKLKYTIIISSISFYIFRVNSSDRRCSQFFFQLCVAHTFTYRYIYVYMCALLPVRIANLDNVLKHAICF